MNPQSKGRTVVDEWVTVDPAKLDTLEKAIGTSTAEQTALLVPFFGPTAGGERVVIDALGMDLSKALQGSQAYEWHRPFEKGERVHMTIKIEDLVNRGVMEIATVLAEFRDGGGRLVQRQRTLFIERHADA